MRPEPFPRDLLSDFDTSQPGHAHIEHRDVRSMTPDARHRIAPAGDGADDRHSASVAESAHQAVSEEGVGVGDKNSDG